MQNARTYSCILLYGTCKFQEMNDHSRFLLDGLWKGAAIEMRENTGWMWTTIMFTSIKFVANRKIWYLPPLCVISTDNASFDPLSCIVVLEGHFDWLWTWKKFVKHNLIEQVVLLARGNLCQWQAEGAIPTETSVSLDCHNDRLFLEITATKSLYL